MSKFANIVLDVWNLDEKSLRKWQILQHLWISNAMAFFLEEMTKDVRFTFSVGDTTYAIYS